MRRKTGNRMFTQQYLNKLSLMEKLNKIESGIDKINGELKENRQLSNLLPFVLMVLGITVVVWMDQDRIVLGMPLAIAVGLCIATWSKILLRAKVVGILGFVIGVLGIVLTSIGKPDYFSTGLGILLILGVLFWRKKNI